MKVKILDKYICIEESIVIILFVCVLSSKARQFLNNYFTCFLFVIFHELAHIIVLLLFNYEIRRINVRISGINAVIKENVSGLKGILIYLAGPISNIILAAMFRNITMVFEINIALAIINLVPIYPLDGYNILKTILTLFTSEIKTKKTIKKIQNISEILLLILSILMCFKYYNFSLFLLLVYIKTNSLQPLKSL
ncbi:MAG: site-2 protease family protein [Clostridia bacterium]|nr:site-2 protease family protein [Clostridia bacterium]